MVRGRSAGAGVLAQTCGVRCCGANQPAPRRSLLTSDRPPERRLRSRALSQRQLLRSGIALLAAEVWPTPTSLRDCMMLPPTSRLVLRCSRGVTLATTALPGCLTSKGRPLHLEQLRELERIALDVIPLGSITARMSSSKQRAEDVSPPVDGFGSRSARCSDRG